MARNVDLGQVKGNLWYYGAGITGTNTSGAIFTDSGVTLATVNDRYQNYSNGYIYVCTVGGAPDVAKWKFIQQIVPTLNTEDGYFTASYLTAD
jgi:hypothetical protein